MLVTAMVTWQAEPLSAWLSARQGAPVDVTEYMIYPAVAASILSLVLVSLLTPASPEAKWKPFMEGG
jgi:hypothetical protein